MSKTPLEYPNRNWQPLFDLMQQEYDLILLESEMKEIIHVVEKISDGQHHARKEDHDKEWESFWKEQVCNPDGTINIEQLKKELHDYSFIMEQVPKVYCHVTDSLLSKVMYHADTVIRVADDHFTEQLRQGIKEAFQAIIDENSTTPTWVTGQYDRLLDQLKADPEKRVSCYVDYDYYIGRKKYTTRDICTIRGKQMEFVSRGHGYGSHRNNGDFKTEYQDKTAFIELCISLKVEWLDEMGANTIERKWCGCSASAKAAHGECYKCPGKKGGKP